MKSPEQIAEELTIRGFGQRCFCNEKAELKCPPCAFYPFALEAIQSERSRYEYAYKLAEERIEFQLKRNADLESKLRKAEEEEVRRIAYLNRLASWAQQDPTGPWEKYEIQEWVLNEIKGALGSRVDETKWKPSIIELKDRLKKAEAVVAAAKKVHNGKKFGWGHAVKEEDWNNLGDELASYEGKEGGE